jgi:hypothetical protein
MCVCVCSDIRYVRFAPTDAPVVEEASARRRREAEDARAVAEESSRASSFVGSRRRARRSGRATTPVRGWGESERERGKDG